MKNRNKYQNSHTNQFINGYPEKIVETTEIASLLKFNFKFLDVNQRDAGFVSVDDLDEKDCLMLWEKVKSFSTESRFTWELKPTGRGENPLLVVYGNIPRNSKAVHPKHVPSDVQ